MKKISKEIIKELVDLQLIEWGVGLCHYTNELVNKGYYLQNFSLYFSSEELLLKFIREVDTSTNTDSEPLSDDFLLEDWYDSNCSGEGFYYSEWADDLDNILYVKVGDQVYQIADN